MNPVWPPVNRSQDHWAETYVTDSCDPVIYETGTGTINQTGNTFTVTIEGNSGSGTVSGATYTATGTSPEDGGTTTDTD